MAQVVIVNIGSPQRHHQVPEVDFLYSKSGFLSSKKSGFFIFQNCISDGNLRPKSGLFASANIATMMCPENMVTVAWNIVTPIIETNCNHRNHHHHHHYQFHNHLLACHRAFLDSATTTPVETSRRVKSHLDLRMIVQFQFRQMQVFIWRGTFEMDTIVLRILAKCFQLNWDQNLLFGK